MATFYFNGAVNGEWTELGNWWTDDTFTTQATALPTSSDSVIASATISSNSGSAPTLVDFTLNDPSMNYLMLTIAITVTGTATFNLGCSNSGTVVGNAVFNGDAFNNGTISGNATFNDSSYNDSQINGNATFNDSSYDTFNGTVLGGTATYNGLTGVAGSSYYIGGRYTTLDTNGTGYWNEQYYLNGTTFVPTAFYFNGAVDSDWNTLGNWWVTSDFTVAANALPSSADDAVVSATVASVAGDPPTVANLTVYATNLTIPITVTGMATFDNYAYNDYSGTVTGNATFNLGCSNPGTVVGNAVFNDDSFNDGTVDGNATFNGTSSNRYYNDYYGTVTGNATFNDSAANVWLAPGGTNGVAGTATYNGLNGVAVYGDYTIYFIGGASTSLDENGTGYWNEQYYLNGTTFVPTAFYFNGAVDSDWNTLGNWWVTSDFTVAANALPSSTDDVVMTATFDNGLQDPFSAPVPTVANMTVNGVEAVGFYNVTGVVTFDNYAVSRAYITGNAVFNDSNMADIFNGNSRIIGDVSFNGISSLFGGTIDGNATFNDYSSIGDGYGVVSGNAEFNDNSYIHHYAPGNVYSSFAANVVGGTATFRNNARNDGGIVGGAVLAYEKGINGSSILGVV